MVHVGRDRGPHHERRAKRYAFEWTEEAFTNHLIAPGHQRPARLEAEMLTRHIVANKLDITWIRHCESALARHTEERNRQRIEAHKLGRNGIDRDRICRGEQEMLHSQDHGAWAGTVAGDRSVHDRKDGRVEFPLHVQQIDKHLMHVFVYIVPDPPQEPAE